MTYTEAQHWSYTLARAIPHLQTQVAAFSARYAWHKAQMIAADVLPAAPHAGGRDSQPIDSRGSDGPSRRVTAPRMMFHERNYPIPS